MRSYFDHSNALFRRDCRPRLSTHSVWIGLAWRDPPAPPPQNQVEEEEEVEKKEEEEWQACCWDTGGLNTLIAALMHGEYYGCGAVC